MTGEERKPIGEFKTDCSFPVLSYDAKVTYNKVKKPSGISYILLELIANSGDVGGYLADVLKEFGIPADLHPIFAEELVKLADTGMVDVQPYTEYAIRNRFDLLETAHLSLTEKGRRMFLDRMTPVDGDRVKPVRVYYDPVTKKHELDAGTTWEYSTSALSEDEGLKERVDVSAGADGMEEFARARKTSIGLKKEEEIIGVDPGEPEWRAVKMEKDMTVSVYPDGVVFSFDKTAERAFTERYYSSRVMENILSKKPKYLFAVGMGVTEADIRDVRPDVVHLPDELTRLADSRCSVFVGTDAAGRRSSDGVRIEGRCAEKMLSMLGEGTLFCLLDGGSCRYFRAYEMRMPCEQFGDVFTMQLLAEFGASDEERERLYAAVEETCAAEPFSADGAKAVAYVAGRGENPGAELKRYAETKIGEKTSPYDKAGALLEIDDVLGRDPVWVPVLREIGGALYAGLTEMSAFDTVISVNSVCNPLRRRLGRSDEEYMADISRGPVKERGEAAAFALFEGMNFKTELILTAVNVIPIYSEMVLKNTEISALGLGIRFNNVRASMWSLNGMLGIDSYTGVIPDDDVPDPDEFIRSAASFDDAWGKIKEYEPYARKEYGEMKAYSDIYRPVRDTLVTERAARENPKGVTREHIDGLLKKGNLKEAVCDLVVRMCHDLAGRLEVDGRTKSSDLIGDAVKAGYIDKDQADMLHKLRICRNGFQHPVEDKRATATPGLVRDCEDIIFPTEAIEK